MYPFDPQCRHPKRRRLLRYALAAAALSALPACGFHLRGMRELPFSTIFLGFSSNSPLGAELARHLRAGTSTRVVTRREEAEAILEILSEIREHEVLALNAEGRAREFQLRLGLTFRLIDKSGNELIGPTLLTAQRDVAFNDAQVLAKESEEALLYRDMQSDVVQQLLRRLAAATPTPVPTPVPTPTAAADATAR